jgi:Pyruvate/2-oxoacid:ferredoxin oxidoreductase delta subunit
MASMEDAVEMMMCGADVIGICTETMLSGFGFLRKWMTSLKAYMEKMGFRTCRDIRDLLLREIKPATDLTIWAGYAQVDPDKCSGCGLCVEIGHCNAIILTDETASVDSKFCHGCSTCMDICPKGAIRMVETR